MHAARKHTHAHTPYRKTTQHSIVILSAVIKVGINGIHRIVPHAKKEEWVSQAPLTKTSTTKGPYSMLNSRQYTHL